MEHQVLHTLIRWIHKEFSVQKCERIHHYEDMSHVTTGI